MDRLLISGVPQLMVKYIEDVFNRFATRLHCEDWESNKIIPTFRVKQGDPLSPAIFNLIINKLFSILPEEVGVDSGHEFPINTLAFADDLSLFAETGVGLQTLLDITAEYLQSCGLKINALKCLTVVIKNILNEKKSLVDAKSKFNCNNMPIPALKRTDEWKYLGVTFTSESRILNNTSSLKEKLNLISAAPLKPQQILSPLRSAVISSLYYLLVLGLTNISILKKLNKLNKVIIRKWPVLPKDIPMHIIYTDSKDGGMAILLLCWVISLQRFHRLRNLKALEEHGNVEKINQFLQLEIKRTKQRLKYDNNIVTTWKMYNHRFSQLLHVSSIEYPLRNSRSVEGQHHWVTVGNLFISGHDFIHMNKI